MGRAGVRVDESIPCPRLTPGEVSARLLGLTKANYRPVAVSATSLQFARTYRPTWATIIGVLLLPVLVGLVILFQRRTETWVATIESSHRQVTLRLVGSILPTHLVALREAMSAGPRAQPAPEPTGIIADSVATPTLGISPIPANQDPSLPAASSVSVAPQGPQSFVPVPVPDRQVPEPASQVQTGAGHHPFEPPIDGLTPEDEQQSAVEATVARVVRRPIPARSVSEGLAAQLEDGQVVPILGTILIGRSPQPREHESGVTCIAVPDSQLGVSKTHLALVRSPNGFHVADRGSVNGVRIERGNGTITTVTEIPTVVAAGDIIHFGGQILTIVDGGEA